MGMVLGVGVQVRVQWNRKQLLSGRFGSGGPYPWHTLERKACSGQMVPVLQQKRPKQKKFEVDLPLNNVPTVNGTFE